MECFSSLSTSVPEGHYAEAQHTYVLILGLMVAGCLLKFSLLFIILVE